ncbi:uncharacterized protein DEA37_0001442, partial [Paragonimus westermani]
LKSRAPDHWSNGSFSRCRFQYTAESSNRKREHVFSISVDDTLLQQTSQKRMIYFEIAYYTNTLLNLDAWDCRTVVGIGQLDDTYIRIALMDVMPLQVLLFLYDLYEIISQIVGKQFVGDQIKVEECQLLEMGRPKILGKRIGKYRLRIDHRPMQANSMYTHFISELTSIYGGCEFNGYWAPFDFPPCKPAFSLYLLFEDHQLTSNRTLLMLSPIERSQDFADRTWLNTAIGCFDGAHST